MLEKIKSLFFKTSEEKTAEVQVTQTIDKTCASLIIEVALADKVFDESEINLLKNDVVTNTLENDGDGVDTTTLETNDDELPF